MHQVLPETRHELIALRVSGELDDEDFATIIPMLEARIDQQGKLRLLWETDDYEGRTTAGFGRRNFHFDERHAADFSRIATVGAPRWRKSLADLMKPFRSATVRHFPPEDRAAALVWLRSED